VSKTLRLDEYRAPQEREAAALRRFVGAIRRAHSEHPVVQQAEDVAATYRIAARSQRGLGVPIRTWEAG
jgi:hypothetical protein